MTILAIALAAIAALGLFAIAIQNWLCILDDEDDDQEDFTDEYPSVLRKIWRDDDER